MDDIKAQTVSRYAALLSDTSFDFTPYFDKAVCEWLSNNMAKVLREQPYVCKYFIKDNSHRQQVAALIPLTSEFNSVLIELIKAVGMTADRYSFNTLVDRMHALNRGIDETDETDAAPVQTVMVSGGRLVNTRCMQLADMLYEYDFKDSSNALSVVSYISEGNFSSFLERFNPLTFKLTEDELHPFMKRLPPEYIKKFVISESDFHGGIYYGREITRLVSAVAQYLPFNELSLLKPYLAKEWGKELFCMSCAMRNRPDGFKSRSGYTLHRRTHCDTANKYPNLNDILGKRLREGK